jgi:regulatory protein
MYKKRYSAAVAWPKIQQFCAYQERSHQEAKEKLYGFGLYKTEVEELIARLIEDNYLNEERFAMGFARGKFRIKKWGRIKIRYELKNKQISEYNIRQALSALDEEEYIQTVNQLSAKKWNALSITTPDERLRKNKVYTWLLQRGFESNIIKVVLAQSIAETKAVTSPE